MANHDVVCPCCDFKFSADAVSPSPGAGASCAEGGFAQPGSAADSPESVIQALRNPATDSRLQRRLIVAAEVLDFDGQVEQLQAALRTYIETHRGSSNPDDLVTVASAIRQYVATMKAADLGAAAMLLDAGHNAPVPLEVELETAKMLVRKLTANPPEVADPHPELSDRLMEMAKTYLSPRLLAREKHGAVAVNSVLAILLLRSRHVDDLLGILANLRVPWFTQLLLRRARRLREELSQRLPPARVEGVCEALDRLVSGLQPATA